MTKKEMSKWKAVEMIENAMLEEYGGKARKFVMKNSWDNVVNDFKEILNEFMWTKIQFDLWGKST